MKPERQEDERRIQTQRHRFYWTTNYCFYRVEIVRCYYLVMDMGVVPSLDWIESLAYYHRCCCSVGFPLKSEGNQKGNKMTYEEKCPICGSEDFEIDDYGEECFDEYECTLWWSCSCSNNHKFSIEKIFKLANVNIVPEGEYEDEGIL